MRVVWTRLSLADLDSARAYIFEEKPGAARRTIKRIQLAVDSIGRHPEIGRPGCVPGTREWVVGGTPFIVAYRFKAGRLEILSIIHGARLWPDQFQA